MNKQAFDQGFIQKCAQYGITDSRQVNYLYKQAEINWDALVSDPRFAPGVGALTGAGLGAGTAHMLGYDPVYGAAAGVIPGAVVGDYTPQMYAAIADYIAKMKKPATS